MTLFCPHCLAYLGIVEEYAAQNCPECQQKLPPKPPLTTLGKPLWQVGLAAPCRSTPVVDGELVVYAWGDRLYRGGVTAYDRFSGELRWQFSTEHDISGGLAARDGRGFVAASGIFGSGAYLAAFELHSGEEIWRQPLAGLVHSPLVVAEMRVYAICNNGVIHGFDSRDGRLCSGYPVQIPEKRAWLGIDGQCLLALSESGRLYHWTAVRGADTPIAQWQSKSPVGCPPTFHRGQVYFWQENGDIVQLNWQRGTSRHLAQGIERVVAAPLVDDKHLYFGSHDHTLHCLQIHEGQEAWQQDCKRSISVTPCLGEGLIVVGTNDGYVYAFEAQSAAPVWKINVSNQSPVLGSPLFHEGVFYLCAEDQQAHALPWHMGQYAWAAHWLAERQDKERSAEYYVLAAMLENHSQEERQQFNHSAIDHWQAAGEWEKAARFCESLIESEPQTIARQYEQAGVTQGSIAPRRAAQLMRQAARWYREAGDSQAADRVNRKAARLAKAPFLTIQGVNIPPQWVAGVAQVVVIEVNNTGNLTAQRLRLRFAGNLVGRQWVEIEYPLPAGDCLEVEATLVAVCSGELVIDIHYQDLGGESWHASQRHPIQVQAAPPSLVVEQDIGMLDVDGHYGNIIVRGSAGLIKVAAVGQNNGMQDGSA